MNVYIPDDSHRMTQRFIQYWPDFYKSVIIDFSTNEYESFYRDLPKSNNGIALTFRFLCNGLDPNLTVIPIKEESFIELFYCVRKDHPKSLALERFSDYVYQNVDVYESQNIYKNRLEDKLSHVEKDFIESIAMLEHITDNSKLIVNNTQ